MSVQATIDLLSRLVAYPTISAQSNLEMAAELAERLENIGAQSELLPSPCRRKANLVARIGPDAPGGLLLSGHMDVVPVAEQAWTTDPFVLRADAGRLYGRGTCDMKGFLAAALSVARLADPEKTLRFVFTYDEEVGCLGARALMPELARRGIRPDQVVVGEPTGMTVIDGHKGCCEYTVRFAGRAGHGSDPARGVSAVEYAARYAQRLLELRGALMMRADPACGFEPPWSTLNIGRIVGGTAHNVIAQTAELAWEMRPVTQADADFVHEQIGACVAELLPQMQAIAPEAAIETEVIGEVVGLNPAQQNATRDLLLAHLGQSTAGVVPFNTEAGLFQELGADVVVCGPGRIAQAHQPDEYLEVTQLEACLTLLGKLVA